MVQPLISVYQRIILINDQKLAGKPGLEPGTGALTVRCSTN